MSSIIEPPPLLAVLVVLLLAAAALWFGLRPQSIRELFGRAGAHGRDLDRTAGVPVGVAEDEEDWGTPEPAAPARQPFSYDRLPPIPPSDELAYPEPSRSPAADESARPAPPVEDALPHPAPSAGSDETVLDAAKPSAGPQAVEGTREPTVEQPPEPAPEREVSLAEIFARSRQPREPQ
jgi:hypothetical protein